MSDRDIIKIAISPKSKQAIDDTCDRYGMSQIELASRLYLWFAEQDEVLQAGILSILPTEFEADIARMTLENIASDKPRSKSSRTKRARRSA